MAPFPNYTGKLSSGFTSKFQNLANAIFKQPAGVSGQGYPFAQGKLITFSYQNWENDPYPLVIVTSSRSGDYVAGVNLHYLTFPFIRNLLDVAQKSPLFSYRNNIKGQSKYVIDAFRSYKWRGIRQVKTLNTDFVISVMATVRGGDPAEVQQIREVVQEQIKNKINPLAEATPEQVLGTPGISGITPAGTNLTETTPTRANAPEIGA